MRQKQHHIFSVFASLIISATLAVASPARMDIRCDGNLCVNNQHIASRLPHDGQFNPSAALSLGKLLGLKAPRSEDGSPNPNEKLDLANGYYTLHYTDVNIPVAGGLAIRLGRTYTSNWEDSATQWFLNAGFVRSFQGVSGYDSNKSDFNAVYVSSNGGSQTLVPTSNGFVTTAHWSGTFDGHQYVLKDSHGVTYTFAHVATPTLLRPPSPMHQVHDYYLTKIADVHGNTIALTYTGDNVTKITSSDGKIVTITDTLFHYPGGTINAVALPTKVMFNGKILRQYQYTEMTTGHEGIDEGSGDGYFFWGYNYVLSKVILPDGRSWQYHYAQHDVTGCKHNYYTPGRIYYLSQVIHPDGEKTIYTVGDFNPVSYIDNLDHFNVTGATRYGLASKTNIDINGDQHTWTYQTLGVNGATRTVRITGPDYAIDETFGFRGNNVLWRDGLLLKRIVYATTAAKTPIETDTFTWDKQKVAAQQQSLDYYTDQVTDPSTVSDSATYTPILKRQVITRGSDSYTTTYADYDTNGNPTTIVQTGDGGASRTFKIHYWQNTLHILHAISDITLDNQSVVHRSFNAMGDITETAHYGVPTTYTYDKTGNKTSQTDANGNLTSVKKGASLWTYTYDANNHVIIATLAIDGHTFTITYTRDNDGYARLVTYPNKEVLREYPNTFGEPTMIGMYIFGIDYAPTGQWLAFSEGDGADVTQSFDKQDHPLSISYDGGAKNPTITRIYSYQKDGHLASINDPNDSTRNISLTYDTNNRLSNAIGPWGALGYTYDANGNLLSAIKTTNAPTGSNATDYHYDKNRDTLTQLTGSNIATFTYDVYGNITSDGSHHYTFGADGNLMTAIAPNLSEAFAYDGNGHRVKVTTPSGTVYNVYNQVGELIYQVNPTAKWTKLNLYLAGHKLAQETTTATGKSIRYFDDDLAGSPIATRDTSGALLAQETYAPYGTRLNPHDDNINTQWYDGKPADKATGLDYYNARYYDPAIGRFISPDPQGFANGKPLTFNRYMFANDDPYGYGDPTGWWSMPSWMHWGWGNFAGGIEFGMDASIVSTFEHSTLLCNPSAANVMRVHNNI